MNRRSVLNITVAGLFASATFALGGCSQQPIGSPIPSPSTSSTQNQSPATSETSSPITEPAPNDGQPTGDPDYFDHVTTNKCVKEGSSVRVVATIKNILPDTANYTLQYAILDPQGQQVGAVGVDATYYNGALKYGDQVRVNDIYGASTGELPADGKFTCKLKSIERTPADIQD